MLRQILKKQYSLKYIRNNKLYILFIKQILKNGKKLCAERNFNLVLGLVEFRTKMDPMDILERSLHKINILYYLKRIYIKNKLMIQLLQKNRLFQIKLAIKWLLFCSKKRSERKFFIRLANEILETLRTNSSLTLKKKAEFIKFIESSVILKK